MLKFQNLKIKIAKVSLVALCLAAFMVTLSACSSTSSSASGNASSTASTNTTAATDGAASTDAARVISTSDTFENTLVVGNLEIGYPADLREPTADESSVLPFDTSMLGDVEIAQSGAVVSDDLGFIVLVSTVDAGLGAGLSDIEAEFANIESEYAAQNSDAVQRAASQEMVEIGSTQAFLAALKFDSSENDQNDTCAYFYVLFDGEQNVIGQVSFYCKDTSEQFDQAYCENILGSLNVLSS
jgi:hypothetical protein